MVLSLVRGLGSVRSLLRVVRSLDLGPVDAEFERPCVVAVTGEAVYREVVVRLLQPVSLKNGRVELVEWEPGTPPPQADLVLQVASAADAAPPRLPSGTAVVQVALGRSRGTLAWSADVELPEAALDAVQGRLAPAILGAVPECSLALARHFPTLRREAARRTVAETCAGNAEMVFMSNFLSVVPIVGNLVEAGSDTLALTTNQIIMLHKLGGIYGRDFHNRRKLFMEILPVVGAALGFRTLAQAAVDFVPTPAAVAPKVAIAYAGTYVVGWLATEYYREGYRPPLAQARERFAEGMREFREWFAEHRPRPPARRE